MNLMKIQGSPFICKAKDFKGFLELYPRKKNIKERSHNKNPDDVKNIDPNEDQFNPDYTYKIKQFKQRFRKTTQKLQIKPNHHDEIGSV